MSQNILITGGAGFLGSAIVKILLRETDYRLYIIQRTGSDLSRLAGSIPDDRVTLRNSDSESMSDWFREPVHAVIHAATRYGRDGESLADIAKTNLLLPLALLSECLERGTPYFLNTDTFFHEEMGLPAPERYYVKTKKDFLRHAARMAEGRDIAFINMIPEQLYGPSDHPKKFLPTMMRALRDNAPKIALSPGMQARDFIFVDDAAAAYRAALLAAPGAGYHEFSLGTGAARTIRSVVEYVKEQIGSASELDWGALQYRDNEILSHAADVKKNIPIGWRAEISFEEGIRRTLEARDEKAL